MSFSIVQKYRKIYSNFMALLMLAQSFVPAFFVFLPSNAHAVGNPISISQVELSLNNENKFELSIESSEDLSYLITYIDGNLQVEKGITGQAISDGIRAEAIEFAGICSYQVCVEDEVISGSLVLPNNNFEYDFVIFEGQLQFVVVPETPVGMRILNETGEDIGCAGYTDNRSITVDWDDSSEADFSHYDYRIREGNIIQHPAASEVSGNIRDEDGYYKYSVRAVDTIGNASEWSDWCGVTLDREIPDAPVQTGYNEDNGDSNSIPRPINELTCLEDATNINGVSIHWTDIADGNLITKYQRQYSVGSGNWSGSEIYTQPYTNYRTFGGGLGNEGTYGSRVRAWKDFDNDNVVDSDEMVSGWSNECSITFDRTAPSEPTGLRRLAKNDHNTVFACGDTAQIQGMHPDWDDNQELDFSHYEYSSFNGTSIGIDERRFDDSIFEYNGSWLPNDGTYGFAVRAVDNAGNKSDWALGGTETFADSCQITYDSTSPAITLDSPAQDSVISGNINLQATCDEDCDYVNFWWRAEGESYSNFSPDRRYHYEHDNGTVFNWTLDSLSAERWGGDPSYVMADGDYYFYAAGKDLVGNWARTLGERKITIDNTAPIATIDSIKYSNGIEELGKFVTNYNNPVILGTATDTNSVATVELSINGYTYPAILSGNDWEVTVANVIPDGLHDMTAVVTDLVGNVTIKVQSIRIDTSAPTAVHTFYKDGLTITDSIAYGQTLGQFTFTGEYSDLNPSSNLYWDSYVIFEAQDDGSFRFSANGKQAFCGWRSAPNLLDISGGSTFFLTTPEPFTNCESSLVDGEYYMAHHIYDTATRKDIPSINQFRDVLGLHFVIDTVNPESIITTFNPARTDETVETNSFDGSIVGTAADDNSGVAKVILEIMYTPFGETESSYWNVSDWQLGFAQVTATDTDSWNYQITPPEKVLEGTYRVTSHAVDNAGNVESTYTITIVYDKTIPEVVLTIDPTSPDGSNGWYRTEPTITLTDSDNYKKDYIQFKWNSGVWTKYTGPINPPSEGQSILYYRGVDAVGNFATTTTDIGVKEVKFDTTSPSEGPLSVRVENIGSTTATGKWEKPDNDELVKEYKLSWKSKETGEEHGETVGSDTFEHELDNLFDGLWEFKVRVMDDAGNSKEATVEFRVGSDPNATVLGVLTDDLGGLVGTQGLVAGVYIEDQTSKEDEELTSEDEDDKSKDSGQVAGATDDSCMTWQFYLPIILLILQGILIIGIEATNRKSSLKKILTVLGISLLAIALFYWLRNPGCYSDSGAMSFLNKWFVISSLSLFVLLKFAASISIEDK